ncbi:hypothetical protein ONV78_11940 [Hahella sp. CR1]|uniref:hypothetical protein n=1 Tax=Hahella sp. CR1 TaxID=2992807 RepID=UPI0024419465|nr:hypothetical protein [Hahella sp. CR1]MDG9668448.1 hypothetical protein [Hahella sp. CR1]
MNSHRNRQGKRSNLKAQQGMLRLLAFYGRNTGKTAPSYETRANVSQTRQRKLILWSIENPYYVNRKETKVNTQGSGSKDATRMMSSPQEAVRENREIRKARLGGCAFCFWGGDIFPSILGECLTSQAEKAYFVAPHESVICES